MNLKTLKMLVNEWKNVEGSSHRWSNLKVRKLIDTLLVALEASQRGNSTDDIQMLHKACKHAEAIDMKLRNLCQDMSYTHVGNCHRQHFDTRATVWDVVGCSRCRGEQTLEDLHITFKAEAEMVIKNV